MCTNRLGLVFTFAILSGCGTPQFFAKGIDPEQASEVDESQLTLEIVSQQIEKDLKTCKDVFALKSSQADERSNETLWWAAVGLAAGSVLAPGLTAANAAANAGWSAALSGLGGASAAMVRNIDAAGMSGAHDINAINALADMIQPKVAIAYSITQPFAARLTASAEARAYCDFYKLTPRVFVQQQDSASSSVSGSGSGT